MSLRKNFDYLPKKWQETKTQEGTLYTYPSNDKRTCLIKNDLTVEVRVNGLLSNYPATKSVTDKNDIKRLLEETRKAHFCAGIQKAGYDCKNVLFPVTCRSSSLVIWCPECRVIRSRYRSSEQGKRRRERLCGVSKEKKMCIVKGCPGRDTSKIKSYPIPPNDIEAWCANLKLDVSQVNDSMLVCSRHFEESCKMARTLKFGARPTLNLGHNDIRYKTEKLVMSSHVKTCCIVGCHMSRPPNKLYRFPEEKELLKHWQLICDIKADFMRHKYKYICAKHFAPTMFSNGVLIKEAVPNMEVEMNEVLTDCVVRNCNGKDSDDIGLYSIPADDINAYCALLNIKKSDISSSTRICSRHFERKYLGSKTLITGARPTLNLGTKAFVLPSLEPKKPLTKRTCCIAGCKADSITDKLFLFPTDEKRLKQWLSVCNFKKNRKRDLRICGQHFDPSMVVDKKLTNDALPIMDSTSRDAAENQKVSLEMDLKEDAIIVENFSDDDSDSDEFDGLECQSSCHTCVQVLSDCKKYRRHYFAMEEHIEKQKERLAFLKQQNQQLTAEFDERMIVEFDVLG